MKSFLPTGVATLLGIACLATSASAQQSPYGTPSLLPVPQSSFRYPISQATAHWNRWQNQEPTPMPMQKVPEVAPAENAPMPMDMTPMSTELPSVEQSVESGQPQQNSRSYPHTDTGCPNCGVTHAPGSCVHGGMIHHHHGTHMHNGSGRALPRGCNSGCKQGYQWTGLGLGLGSCGFGSHFCGAGNYVNRKFAAHSADWISRGQTRCGWYGGVYGLIMTRDQEDHYWFSYGDGAEHIQLLDTRDASMNWAGGVEARAGYYFNCGRTALELVYWGIYPQEQESILTSGQVAGNLNAILNWDQLELGGLGGQAAETWVNAADAHRVARSWDIHNLELNLLNYSGCSGFGACCQRRWNHNWGVGIRYFNFSEDLEFNAREAGSGAVFGNAAEQVNYEIDIDNHLVGFQWFGEGRYNVTNALSLTFGTKLGIYGNHINHHSFIHSNGTPFVIDNGPNAGRVWNVLSDKNDVAFLGELNLGIDYRLSRCWTITGGYRGLAATGLALPSEQIYPDLRGIDDAILIGSNSSLILHGAFIGAEFNY